VSKLASAAPRGGRRRAPLFVAALGVAIAAAACGGGSGGAGVAGAGAPTRTGSSSSSHPHGKGSPLALAQCMRAHGVSNFPDPDTSGRIAVQASPGSGLDPTSPQFQAAQQACKAFAPPGLASGKAGANRADTLNFARCMRRHGVPDFPDPSPQGGIQITGGPGGDLDPSSPAFQSAQRACQHYLPGGGKGPRLQTNGSGGPQ
jgi:hypothetical protein